MSVEQGRKEAAGTVGDIGQDRQDPWRLTHRGVDTARAARDETLFALANGTLGVRGALEEGDSASDGTFLSSVFEQNPIHYHERFPGFTRSTDTRVPVAEGKHIRLQLGDAPLRLQEVEWLDFERTLDLAAGALDRRLRLKTTQGNTLEIRARRVVPLAERALLAIHFEVASIDYAGPLTLCSSIETGRQAVEQGDDPRIGVHGGTDLQVSDEHADADGARLTQRTHHSGVVLVCAQHHRLSPGLVFEGAATTAGRVEQRYTATLMPGASVVVEKFVAYDDGNGHTQDGVDAVLARALREGFDGIAGAQADAMQAFWLRAGLSVDGDPAAELALRFNLFHLLQSAGRDGITGTAAKGITGEGYEGHCFWDTEAFVLPVMALTAPDVARAMLMYRYRTLDGARDTARAMNHPRGALYPWRTIAGRECSAHYPSGSAAYHINAAIAYGIGLYLDASDDLDFLSEAGAEILFETARIWPQAGHFNPRLDGAFCIHEVTGPDEYTTLVNNNWYTNRMAQRHLQRAVEAWNRLSADRPEVLHMLAARIGLDADEVALWQRAADAMYLPVDDALGIHPQDDDFLAKPRWPFPKREGPHRPLLLDYHPLTLYRHQVCKQADVAMAMVLAGDGIPLGTKRRDFDYYEAVTTHDSTLSAPVYGILASEVGHEEKAWRYFDASLRVDLDDLHGNTDHGVHMAAMAGSWLGLVQGFGGLRIVGGRLQFAPTLPTAWKGYGFNLRWRGCALRVDVDARGARYRLDEGDALAFGHAGSEVMLKAGREVALPLAVPSPPKMSLPRACDALIFDLDGVLTDTAHTHYRAWKRLADEIGVPFDLQVNERLKGVDRMASLEIILERAARSYSADEKRALADTKNGYYVQEIANVGPQDLFDGVCEVLDAARAAGLKLGLASASRNAPALLQKLGIAGRFDYIADAGRIVRAKPDPAIFLDVAAALGVPAHRCIGVEDAAAGIEAIHAAGMAAVGIGDARALRHADAVVPRIADFNLRTFVSP
ncbi:alpha,alpha-trehalose phosphorylase [Pseudoxanthomonas sp. 3HH-4]|uniref:beta-phosphoglucomutase n=1 Tax=Pseudoxanthomonas sp. 3HH-4 TaxID=1690214 RepID=UPI001154C61D|nr:beta-phosphoglucomutase [Pseudoxanthomonas sp. 3HH-4]TQM05738.1 alpha,alpha-trehalose phosphorylase [Pseudoxanthomonas sp. 3HH-4]